MSIKISTAIRADSAIDLPSCTWSFDRAREILNRFGFFLDPTDGGAYRASDIIKALDADRQYESSNPFDRLILREIATFAFTLNGSDALVLAFAASPSDRPAPKSCACH